MRGAAGGRADVAREAGVGDGAAVAVGGSVGGGRGVLLTDGYGVYESRSRAKGFVQAHDWCHARRYFLEAESTEPDIAGPILDDIGKLFVIEREIAALFEGRTREDALEIRRRHREERSTTVVNAIGERATAVRVVGQPDLSRREIPREPVGRTDAVLSDPRVPITSNAAEAALRCLVLGRSNHFGSKSERGTQVAAMFYSLIESARMNGLDPAQYLRLGAAAHLRDQPVPLPHELRAAQRAQAVMPGAPVAARDLPVGG